MLHWLFTVYRAAVAPWLVPPLLLAALVAAPLSAYALGKPGKKVARNGAGMRERRLTALALAVVALAAIHLVLLTGGGLAVRRTFPSGETLLSKVLFGPPGYDRLYLALGGMALLVAGGAAASIVHVQIKDGGALREWANRLRDPLRDHEELGSAHFCYPGDFVRLQKPKGDYELRLLGAFYGKRGRGEKAERFYRLDRGPNRNNHWPWVALSAEDQARGMALFGPTGTGKSQAGILPVAADAMRGGQSLVVLDPQGELLPHVLDYARVTGHLVVVHDPTDASLPRFNLTHGVRRVSDAQAVARVLAGGTERDDFWLKSARNLLAACLLRYDSLGDILRAFDDMQALADTLTALNDGAANVARAFAASVRSGDRSAPGVLATLQASTLSAWADDSVQQATAATDFSADTLAEEPAVLVLKCPGRYMKVYGPYLGAVLQRLMLDLDAIGEATPGGMLQRPVKIVIDEFLVMGRLEGIVEAVNLFRKRHISILIAAQTIAQLELVYGKVAAETLIAGLATQIYFGSCDAATARFVSQSLGKATERVRPRGKRPDGSPYEAQARQRELMSVDEVITPPRGNCTLIHRYATTTYATQVVLLVALTYMFERQDWDKALRRARGVEPRVMEKPLFARREPVEQARPVSGERPDVRLESEGY